MRGAIRPPNVEERKHDGAGKQAPAGVEDRRRGHSEDEKRETREREHRRRAGGRRPNCLRDERRRDEEHSHRGDRDKGERAEDPQHQGRHQQKGTEYREDHG